MHSHFLLYSCRSFLYLPCPPALYTETREIFLIGTSHHVTLLLKASSGFLLLLELSPSASHNMKDLIIWLWPSSPVTLNMCLDNCIKWLSQGHTAGKWDWDWNLKSLNSMCSTFFISLAHPHHHISKMERGHKNIKPMNSPISLVISVLRYLVTSVNYNLMLLWSPRVTIIKWKMVTLGRTALGSQWDLGRSSSQNCCEGKNMTTNFCEAANLPTSDSSSFPFLVKTFKNLVCVSGWVRITCLSVFGI